MKFNYHNLLLMLSFANIFSYYTSITQIENSILLFRLQDENRTKKLAETDEQLLLDKRNTEFIIQQEEDFQRYAQSVIEDAESCGRNTLPLIKSARDGPGGGRGPKCEGNAGLRPSYMASDATGVQLCHLPKDEMLCNRTYGHVGKSGKRVGFNW